MQGWVLALPPEVAPLVPVVKTPHEVVKAEDLSQVVRSFIPAEPVAMHLSFAFARVVAACVRAVGVAAHICHHAKRRDGQDLRSTGRGDPWIRGSRKARFGYLYTT